MGLTLKQSLILGIFFPLLLNSSAKTCSNYKFSTDAVFDSCHDLPYLKAYLHWNYIPSTRILHIAYRAAQTSTGWIAWAINPTGTGMIGSQSIVAFLNSNGSMTVYPTPITSYYPSMQTGDLSFKVSNMSAEYNKNEMTIFAVLGPLSKGTTTINHVWQAGSISGDVPQMHSATGENVQSMGTVDLVSKK